MRNVTEGTIVKKTIKTDKAGREFTALTVSKETAKHSTDGSLKRTAKAFYSVSVYGGLEAKAQLLEPGDYVKATGHSRIFRKGKKAEMQLLADTLRIRKAA